MHGSDRIAKTLAVLCLCAMCAAPAAEAGRRRVFADLDADGRRDGVTLDTREPWLVRIWLSATRSTHVIRSVHRLRAITLVDLNGDRRPEAVASTRSHGLQVWTTAGTGFVAYPRKPKSSSRHIRGSGRHEINDDNDESAPGDANVRLIPASIVSDVQRRAPSPHVGRRGAEQPPGGRLDVPLAPLSPLPPPVSL